MPGRRYASTPSPTTTRRRWPPRARAPPQTLEIHEPCPRGRTSQRSGGPFQLWQWSKCIECRMHHSIYLRSICLSLSLLFSLCTPSMRKAAAHEAHICLYVGRRSSFSSFSSIAPSVSLTASSLASSLASKFSTWWSTWAGEVSASHSSHHPSGGTTRRRSPSARRLFNTFDSGEKLCKPQSNIAHRCWQLKLTATGPSPGRRDLASCLASCAWWWWWRRHQPHSIRCGHPWPEPRCRAGARCGKRPLPSTSQSTGPTRPPSALALLQLKSVCTVPHAPRALKQLQLALRSKAEPGAERSAAGAQIQKKTTDEMNSAYAGIAFATASAMKNVPQSFYPVDTLPSNACLITPLYVHCQKISVHSTPVVLYTMAKRVHGGDALEDSPAAQVSVVANLLPQMCMEEERGNSRFRRLGKQYAPRSTIEGPDQNMSRAATLAPPRFLDLRIPFLFCGRTRTRALDVYTVLSLPRSGVPAFRPSRAGSR